MKVMAKKITAIIVSVIICMTMALTVSASENYKVWTQGDYRWANKSLGSCGDTMSEIGCAVTSLAILAVHSQSASADEFNPGILCDYLSKNNGFDSYGNLYWAAVSGIVPDFTFQKKAKVSSSTESGITAELADYINQGYYVVLSVRYDAHWVAIDTISDGEVYMVDPAQNKVHKLFDYYDGDGMLQVRLYKGKTAPAKVNTSAIETPVYLTGHYKTTTELNQRVLYTTTSNILATIPAGKTVVVTRIYNNQWGQVEYNGETGWIYLEYTEYTEPAYTYKNGSYKVNVESGVYLRRGVGTQSTSVCLVPYNGLLNIDLVTANWGRTSYGGQTGWICMEYVTYVSPAVTTAVTTKVTTTTTKVSKTSVTTAAPTTTAVTSSELPLIKGDVNRDGIFTKTDLILLNAYIADPVKVSFDRRYVMDVNHDQIIDERDSVYLLKIINKGN